MDNKIIEGLINLQSDIKDADKEFSDSLDRIIAICDSCLEILTRIEGKLDQI